MADIEWLQNWYLQNCNGTWEHEYGLAIATIDNPGWQISINLKGTKLENQKFMTLEKGMDDDKDWYQISIEQDELDGPIFAAYCSPQNLNTVIGIFKTFSEKGA